MANRGKKICNVLRAIRKEVAEVNQIAYQTDDCLFQGECLGTCPKCEAELRYLEHQLALRKKAGKVIGIAGIASSLCMLSACQSSPSESQGGAESEVPMVETEIEPNRSLSEKTIKAGEMEDLRRDSILWDSLSKLIPPLPDSRERDLEPLLGMVGPSSDSDSVVSVQEPILVTEKDVKAVVKFLSDLYGLNEYQGFMFMDLDFLLPHCTERLLQKLQADFGEEEGYATDDFRTPAQEGNSINVLESVIHKKDNTYIVTYLDRGHRGRTEIDAYVVAGQVLLDDVRLISWSEALFE
ncbi:MAG: hypothetical protein J5554_11125 [Paludibacteraceae bacterium]|nr:hypothetical protein [Paludibacteraceae bacterium]